MSRFDPNANVQALLGGVRTGIALREEERRAQRDAAILALEQEEAQFRRAEADRRAMAFQQTQDAAKAAQQFQANEYMMLTGQPAFDQTADAWAAGDMTGVAQGMGRMQEVQQQQPLFAQLPPAMQAEYLAPLQKEAEIRRRRRMADGDLYEMFPGPDYDAFRKNAMDDWDMLHLHGFSEETIRRIRDGQPMDITQFRAMFDPLGLPDEQVNRLAAGELAARGKVPAGVISSVLNPGGSGRPTVEQALASLQKRYPRGNPEILRGAAESMALGLPVDLPEVSVTGQPKATDSYQKTPEYELLSRGMSRAEESYKDALQYFRTVEADVAELGSKAKKADTERLNTARAEMKMARMARDQARAKLDDFTENAKAEYQQGTQPAPSPSPRESGAPSGAPAPSLPPAAPVASVAPGQSPAAPTPPATGLEQLIDQLIQEGKSDDEIELILKQRAGTPG